MMSKIAKNTCGSLGLALAAVVLALAAPDAAEIDPKGREAGRDEGLEQRVDDPIVHRAAMLGMGMKHQGDRCVRCLVVGVASLEAACRAVYRNFRHIFIVCSM